MYDGKLVFAQVMEFLPRHEFDKAVRRYRGNYRVRGFSCRDQFLAMAFAQLTYRESLRDIETCLRMPRPIIGRPAARSRTWLEDAHRRAARRSRNARPSNATNPTLVDLVRDTQQAVWRTSEPGHRRAAVVCYH